MLIIRTRLTKHSSSSLSSSNQPSSHPQAASTILHQSSVAPAPRNVGRLPITWQILEEGESRQELRRGLLGVSEARILTVVDG